MSSFASSADLALLWRPLTENEKPRAQALLELVSASLRAEAKKVGRDLDTMLAADPALAAVAKSVTADVAARALMTATDAEPMTQMTQTAGPYTVSGSYLVPGGGLFIKKSELARLGLRRQRYGVMEVYSPAPAGEG